MPRRPPSPPSTSLTGRGHKTNETLPRRPLPALDLRLTEENLEDLYEHAPCGYCSCLPDGTLVKLNQTLLGWLGYARESWWRRRALQQLLTMGGRLHYETHGVPLLLLQGQVRELSYALRRRDGSTLPVLLNAALVRDAGRQPLVVRVTLFDITERRKYEQELLREGLAEEQREQLAQQLLTHKTNSCTRIQCRPRQLRVHGLPRPQAAGQQHGRAV